MQMKTIAEIATQLQTPQHRVRYAIERAGIEPTDRIGGRFVVFNKAAVKRIQAELRSIDRSQYGRPRE